MAKPLMPKATAVWLVENTGLTFEQIADFCELHSLEVQAIADEEVGAGIVGNNPIQSGELTQDEITRCEGSAKAKLKISEPQFELKRRNKGPRYTPVSKRQDKPDGIAWLLKHHPELSDAQLSRLLGTTKPTISSIRERKHWNIQQIKARNPVMLGLCPQPDLEDAIKKAHERLIREGKEAPASIEFEEASLANMEEPPEPNPLPAVDNGPVDEKAQAQAELKKLFGDN